MISTTQEMLATSSNPRALEEGELDSPTRGNALRIILGRLEMKDEEPGSFKSPQLIWVLVGIGPGCSPYSVV